MIAFAPVPIPNPVDTKIILGKILSKHAEHALYSKVILQKEDGTLMTAFVMYEDAQFVNITNKLCYLEIGMVKANDNTYYNIGSRVNYHFPVSGLFIFTCAEKATAPNTISFN